MTEIRDTLKFIIITILILLLLSGIIFGLASTLNYHIKTQCKDKCSKFGYSFLDIGFGGFHCECLKENNEIIIIER